MKSVNQIMKDAVNKAQKQMESAVDEYDYNSKKIEIKVKSSINLLGGTALQEVSAIVDEVSSSCEKLYSTCQAILIMLDETCRPLLDQSPDAAYVGIVWKQIVELNKRSNIEVTYDASLNGSKLGDLANIHYHAPLSGQIIEKYWEEKFKSIPGASEKLRRYEQARKKEAKEAEEKRKNQEQERKQRRIDNKEKAFQQLQNEANALYESVKDAIVKRREAEIPIRVNKATKQCEKTIASLEQEKILTKNTYQQETLALKTEEASLMAELTQLGIFHPLKKKKLSDQLDSIRAQLQVLPSEEGKALDKINYRISDERVKLIEFKTGILWHLEREIPFPQRGTEDDDLCEAIMDAIRRGTCYLDKLLAKFELNRFEAADQLLFLAKKKRVGLSCEGDRVHLVCYERKLPPEERKSRKLQWAILDYMGTRSKTFDEILHECKEIAGMDRQELRSLLSKLYQNHEIDQTGVKGIYYYTRIDPSGEN